MSWATDVDPFRRVGDPSVTTCLLRQDASSGLRHGGPADLVEAAALPGAFIRAGDPGARRRGSAEVQSAAEAGNA